MDLAAEWLDRLRAEAEGYARLALENIAREFPTQVSAAAMRAHAEASLPHVVADHYMVTHWLAAYAVLLFS